MSFEDSPAPAGTGDGGDNDDRRDNVPHSDTCVNLSTFLELVRKRLSFLELARAFGFSWTTGREYNCPSGHSSQSGSCCRIYETHAYCFSCKKRFDHVRFIEAVRNVSCDQALAVLAQLSETPLPEGAAKSYNSLAEDELADVLAARTVFAQKAHEKLTAEHVEYLVGRGITQDTIVKFLIGSSVPGIIALMQQEGWPDDLLVKAGLVENQNGSLRQFMTERITFPTMLPDGRVVDINARITRDDSGGSKYFKLPVRSDQHPLISDLVPRGVPFGAQLLSNATSRIVIVEGPFDCLALVQRAQVAIALQTNTISKDQIAWLKHRVSYSTDVIIIPDADQAGSEGALETSLALQSLKIDSKIAYLPRPAGGSKTDPADYFRTKTVEEAHEHLKSGVSALVELAGRYGRADLAPLQAIEAVKCMIERLADHLDKEGVVLALDSFIWGYFKNLHKSQHRRQIDRLVHAFFEKRAEFQREAQAKLIQMSVEDRDKALVFLRDPQLIARIGDDLEALGYVGEECNKILLYLVASSRKMVAPLSANILSPSSAGKTGLIHVVARCMPVEEIFRVSRTTPRALFHMRSDALKHRWFVIEERDGLADGEYPVRTLQTEQKLTLLIPMKNPDTEEIVTIEKVVEGPIAYCDASTAMSIEEQNATRGFTLHIDVTSDQTKRIQSAQANAVTREGRHRAARTEKLATLHQNAQRLFRKGLRVDIPFASIVEFPSHLIRTRRDFPRFLALIQAVAFLHQFQRKIKTETVDGAPQEFIEATVSDYAIAYGIARRAILSAVDDLNAHARDILQRTVEWLKDAAAGTTQKPEAIPFTRADIVQKLGIDRRIVEKYVPDLHHHFFKVIEGGQGSTYRYQLAGPDVVRDFTPALNITSPEDLARKIATQSSVLKQATDSCADPSSTEEVGKCD